VSPDAVAWSIEWSFGSTRSLPVTAVKQDFRLSEGRLDIEASVQGVYDLLGFEIPCLVTAGGPRSEVRFSRERIVVGYEGWMLTAEVRGAERCDLEEILRANRYAHYSVARFTARGPSITVGLSLLRADE
jgi:hypothetical protein